MSSEWSEFEINWSNSPSNIPDESEVPLASNNNSNLWGWEDYDLTDHIQQIVDGDTENYGYSIINSTEGKGAFFHSSQYKEIEFRPKLTIQFDSQTEINNTIKHNHINFNQIYDIDVLNLQGKKIKSFKDKKVNTISNNLPSGIHILQLKKDRKVIMQRCLKVK